MNRTITTIATLMLLCGSAGAHPVKNTAGEPTELVYEGSCCHSALTETWGDCAPIDDKYVTERADGWHVDLPAGAHPKLKTKGYSGIVPYDGARRPLDNQYHICLSPEGGHRYCFYPKPGMM